MFNVARDHETRIMERWRCPVCRSIREVLPVRPSNPVRFVGACPKCHTAINLDYWCSVRDYEERNDGGEEVETRSA